MVNVTSEIGRLRRALVHEPGAEVDRMVPGMMEQLLFDDILYGDRARDEHGRFRRVLQLLGVDVVEVNDLLVQALEQPGARDWVIDVLFDELAEEDRQRLHSMAGAELTAVLITGSVTRAQPCGVEAEDLFEIPPLPNWCFQRDPQIVLGSGVVFSSMAAAARYREAMLSRAIFRFHPQMKDVEVWFDPVQADRALPSFLGQHAPCLEGGDVLVLSPDVLAVGLSERTNRAAVRRLARALARRERGPRWLYAVDVPRRRAYMHLDTLITPVDSDACLVYPPVILDGGVEQARVHAIDLHSRQLDFSSSGPLLAELARQGLALEPIPCGGADPVAQQREQWTDGANALAVAPGVITLYDRNIKTATELDRHGFRIVDADDLLLGRAEVDIQAGKRVCILISSNEISRARGGPHCLVHPLVRD